MLNISIHAPRAGCDYCDILTSAELSDFNPRTPCGVRLSGETPRASAIWISIHAPRAGCDIRRWFPKGTDFGFQSTHPVRGATGMWWIIDDLLLYFNPRTPCGGRPGKTSSLMRLSQFQSTHPVRGATGLGGLVAGYLEISIHAPRAGCDVCLPSGPGFEKQFQSTHPVRGATFTGRGDAMKLLHFNPRTPCGVRRASPLTRGSIVLISIHAPRAGCDLVRLLILSSRSRFQSTHPVRGATGRGEGPVFL